MVVCLSYTAVSGCERDHDVFLPEAATLKPKQEECVGKMLN